MADENENDVSLRWMSVAIALIFLWIVVLSGGSSESHELTVQEVTEGGIGSGDKVITQGYLSEPYNIECTTQFGCSVVYNLTYDGYVVDLVVFNPGTQYQYLETGTLVPVEAYYFNGHLETDYHLIG